MPLTARTRKCIRKGISATGPTQVPYGATATLTLPRRCDGLSLAAVHDQGLQAVLWTAAGSTLGETLALPLEPGRHSLEARFDR